MEKHKQIFMTPFPMTVPNQKNTQADEREAQLCNGVKGKEMWVCYNTHES